MRKKMKELPVFVNETCGRWKLLSGKKLKRAGVVERAQLTSRMLNGNLQVSNN